MKQSKKTSSNKQQTVPKNEMKALRTVWLVSFAILSTVQAENIAIAARFTRP